MIPILRPYQDSMVADIRSAFARYRRVLAVAPTGSGKTITFAYITANATLKQKRVVIAAHREEIVRQISVALDAMGVRHGRIQAGHRMTDDLVQVAMIVTLGKKIQGLPSPDLLVIDECHHAVSPSYRAVAEAWPTTRILGVTATPARLDGRGLGGCFDTMIIGPQTADLIAQGFLAPYRYLAPPVKIDLSEIRTSRGDYAIDELGEAMDKTVIVGDAISHYRAHLDGKAAIAFCVTVQHAEHTAEAFAAAGYRAASVDGSMGNIERRIRMESIGDGRLQVLTSCDLISEGVDVPIVSGAILLRPTKSLALNLQQIGRVLRPKPDRSHATILDHVGNVHVHGMPDAARSWSLVGKDKSKAPPTATCEVCYRVFGTFPGWKLKEQCNELCPDGCVLTIDQADAGGGRPSPEVVDGQLTQFTNMPSWSDGLNIATVRGPDWGELLQRADTVEKLKEIARARGYHWRWINHIMKARTQSDGRN